MVYRLGNGTIARQIIFFIAVYLGEIALSEIKLLILNTLQCKVQFRLLPADSARINDYRQL